MTEPGLELALMQKPIPFFPYHIFHYYFYINLCVDIPLSYGHIVLRYIISVN